MASKEGCSTNKAPFFTGENYAFWKFRMKTYIMSLGIEVWATMELGYALKSTDTEKEAKESFVANAKAMNAILNGLCEAEFIKVMHKDTAKKIWDTLEGIHEGDQKVKTAKLQVYRAQFENLKMNDDEDVGSFFLKVAEIVNNVKALGETILESIIFTSEERGFIG